MKPSTQRSILRWAHILVGLPIVGYIYGPQEEVQQYVDVHRYFLMPALLLSGFWMWQGQAIVRQFSKRSPAASTVVGVEAD